MMRTEDVGKLATERQDRIEMLTGIGERQSELLAADRAELRLCEVQQFAIPKPYMAPGHPPRGLEKAGDSMQEHRLAATGLANQTERLAIVDVKIDPMQHLPQGPVAVIGDAQCLNLEQRDHVYLRLVGSRKMRRLSPKREKARTVRARQMPGKSAVHHCPVIMF
jgi:hypothetical protein